MKTGAKDFGGGHISRLNRDNIYCYHCASYHIASPK